MSGFLNITTCLFAGVTISTATAGIARTSLAPTGAEIADRYTEVTGGMAAYDRVKNRVQRATVSLPAQDVEMDVTIYLAKPNKSYLIIDAPQIGTIKKGTIDGVVWETSLMTGPVIKEGSERDDGLVNAAMDRWVYWRKTYKSVELIGESKVDNVACYDVKLTPAKGHSQTLSYAQESGLLLRISAVLDSQMGEIEILSYLSDYREVDDILLPHETRVDVMGQQRSFKVKSYKHNVDLPEDRFDPPVDVKAILTKK